MSSHHIKKLVILWLLFTFVFSQQLQASIYSKIDENCPTQLSKLFEKDKEKISTLKLERDQSLSDPEALQKIDLKIRDEIPKLKDDLGVALADDAGVRIAEAYEKEVYALNQKINEFRECGNNLSCLKVRGQKILLWADHAKQSIAAGIKAEGQAKEMLVDAAESMANQIVAIEKYEEVPLNHPLKSEFLQKVEDSFNNTPPSAQNYFLNLGMIYWDNLKALFSKSLITNPQRLMNFGKDITTILTIQQVSKAVFTKIGWLSGTEPFKNSAWVIPNTLVMVYLGWVKGGEATPEVDRPFSLNDGDAFRALATSIYGAKGFKTDLQRRFSSLVTLFFAELPIMYLVRTVTDHILHVSTSTTDLTSAAILFGQTATFLAGFHLFLATRGSLIDKPLFLNILPNLKKGTRLSFEVGLYNTLRERGELQSDVSLADFQKRLLLEKDYQNYKSYFKLTKGLEGNFSQNLADLNKQRTVLIPAGEWSIRLFNEATGSLLLFAWLQAVNAVFAHFST